LTIGGKFPYNAGKGGTDMESMELVLQELRKINGRLDALEGKVDRLQEDVTELKEAHEVTRDGVNALLEWSDKISEVQRFPLPKI